MGHYNPEFPIGSRVRIAGRDVLNAFVREWKFHHPLSANQCEMAGQVARVIDIGYYHGGDVLYTLEGIEGVWHEQLLSVES